MRTSMILLAVFLTACGGGGSESTTATAVPSGPHIGRLVLGGPISGVGYETATFSGTTDANGEFEYMGGERVRFFVGPLTLADQIPGAAEIDPAGLVPGSAMPETARDVRAFLQIGRASCRERVSIAV